ncbi:MAG: tRNA (adenosine(37)-N6)-threonylcarbamoyltransferase complex transferase subunit TsaD [Clostridia bacterium]|nr:tRNA (adenosine(37)-N6)-threonylcarbamoyltransferase complex transferase subunit TsaD [Clostridia bacterium]
MNAEERYRQLTATRSGILLSIETSCDETAAAVVKNGREVLSNTVYTQIPLHKVYGGVVPEIASRSHVEKIGTVVDTALTEAGVTHEDLSGIVVTHGPGLVGALLVGLNYAKGLSLAWDLPFAGVNHIASHIAANYITFPDLEPPFTCLVASGGHSHIIRVDGYNRYTLIGRTRDDAAGEAFDKIARILGLPYPGGPELEKLAKEGDPKAIRFRSAFNEGDSFDFSFSGLKTAAINELHTREQRGETVNRADIAASFQHTLVEVLSEKAVRAAVVQGDKTLALAGGVSANTALREALRQKCERRGIRFCCPDFRYCTDNAAMVGSAGFYRLLSAPPDGFDLNAVPNLAIV